MVTHNDIVKEAWTWLDVPWQDKGRTRYGVDCAGVVFVVAHALDITDYEDVNYPRRPDGTIVQRFRDNMDPVTPIAAAIPGDILLFADKGELCHCGIIVNINDQLGLIHSHAGHRGVLVETLKEVECETGRPRYAFRYRGIED